MLNFAKYLFTARFAVVVGLTIAASYAFIVVNGKALPASSTIVLLGFIWVIVEAVVRLWRFFGKRWARERSEHTGTVKPKKRKRKKGRR